MEFINKEIQNVLLQKIIDDSDSLHIFSANVTTPDVTDYTSLGKLLKADLPSMTIGDRVGSSTDRSLSISRTKNINITTGGTANSVALVNSSNKILWAVSLATPQSVSTGNVMAIENDVIEVRVG